MENVSRRSLVAGTAALAATAAVGSLARQAKAVPVSDVAAWDYEYDVVVCGSGAGGAPAAIEAHDAGAEVVVIESMDWAGGQLRRCGGGVAGAGTKVQAALGVEDSADAMFEYWMAMGQGFCDEELVRDFCDNSGALVDWIIDDLGGQPVEEWEFSDGADGLEYNTFAGLNVGVDREMMEELGFEAVPRCHWFTQNPDDEFIGNDDMGLFPTAGGTGLWKTFSNALDERGVQIMLETALVRLVTQPSTNEVVGVVAKQGDAEVYIKARKGVVVATGNFASNHEMRAVYTMDDYTENLWGAFGQDLPGENDGSGINACLAVGAQWMYPGKQNMPFDHSLDGDYAFMLSGLKIDRQARAIDVFGEPIPRLYLSSLAAGAVMGGAYPCCGASVGRNLYFGRVAGQQAAALDSWE